MDTPSRDKIRLPVVSGTFYPRSPSTLRSAVREMLAQVPERRPQGEVLALVVPHAGYQYSGSVAAHAYRLLEGRQFERVILIGTSHRYGLETASVYQSGIFEVPTRQFPYRRGVCREACRSRRVAFRFGEGSYFGTLSRGTATFSERGSW